jgi:hypothetical protein
VPAVELWGKLLSAASSAWNDLSGLQRLIAGAVIGGGGLLVLYLLLEWIRQVGKYLVLLVAVAGVVHLCFPDLLCSSTWSAKLEMICR